MNIFDIVQADLEALSSLQSTRARLEELRIETAQLRAELEARGIVQTLTPPWEKERAG